MIERAFIEEFSGPFEWGARDCARMAAEAVRRATGRTLVECPVYGTETEALSLVDNAGSMEELVSSVLGPSEGPDAFPLAEDYDVVLTSFYGVGPTLAVASPPNMLVLTERGLLPLDLERFGLRIWRCRRPLPRS